MLLACHETVSDYPRSVFDAPSDEDVRTLVESARDQTLMERRRQNLVLDRELSFFTSWTRERLAFPVLTKSGYYITESYCFLAFCGFTQA